MNGHIPDLRRFLVLGLVLLAITCVGLVKAYHPQKANPEKSTEYNSKGEVVNVEKTYDNNNRLLERKEFDPNTGKLKKRISYKYLKGFKEPNTSETRYGPDGTSVTGTTNIDRDKDGEATSTSSTEYDASGKETGGSKRERDGTGKERCYNWNTTKQAYEEVECTKPWVSGLSMNDSAPSKTKEGQVVTNSGLETVVFDTSAGTLRINLPNDMMAGDTISGTVIVEPKGSNEQERAKNQDLLSGYVVEIGNQKLPASTGSFKWSIPISLPQTQTGYPVAILDASSKHVADTTIPVQAAITYRGDQGPRVLTGIFAIPAIGQQGRSVTITGPFDGDSSNTRVDFRPPAAIGMSGDWNGMVPLAESPRKLIFRSPANVSGPMEIRVKERTTETKGPFRNIGVNLTAPKTSLRKGESTTLKVEVSGLQGITEPIPLHLTKGGVVNMQGGDAQTMSIRPAEVSSSGTFTTTRTITGVRAGAWNATATVVVFDICIQDDDDPSRILLLMTETGDFKFCPGHGPGGGPTPPLSTTDFNGGISIQAGDGLDVVTRHGAISAGDFRFTGGQMKLLVDHAAHTGSATVQTKSLKQTFTINDRDTRNNTCACN